MTPEEAQRRRRFGQALERALDAKGATQTRMAEALGINQTTVSSWVRGVKRPRYREDVERIEEWLGAESCAAGTLAAILYEPPIRSDDRPAALHGKIDRLPERDRRAVERLVDEMLGPE